MSNSEKDFIQPTGMETYIRVTAREAVKLLDRKYVRNLAQYALTEMYPNGVPLLATDNDVKIVQGPCKKQSRKLTEQLGGKSEIETGQGTDEHEDYDDQDQDEFTPPTEEPRAKISVLDRLINRQEKQDLTMFNSREDVETLLVELAGIAPLQRSFIDDGIRFTRLPDGSILLETDVNGFTKVIHISAGIWVSTILTMTAHNERPNDYQCFLDHHQGHVDVLANVLIYINDMPVPVTSGTWLPWDLLKFLNVDPEHVYLETYNRERGEQRPVQRSLSIQGDEKFKLIYSREPLDRLYSN